MNVELRRESQNEITHCSSMNVTLIPYFLAANVAVGNNWVRGPEWTYHLQINVTLINPTEIKKMNESMEIRCQSRDEESIVCVPKWPDENYTTGAYLYKFNEIGVESLTYEQKNRSDTNLIFGKVLGDFMSVGTNINKKKEITTGMCNAKFYIDLEEPGRTKRKREIQMDESTFRLQPMTGWTKGSSTDILKITDPETCPFYLDFYSENLDFPITIVSYRNKIFIEDPSTFKSYQRVEMTYTKSNNSETQENVIIVLSMLKLVDIHEIEDDISVQDKDTATVYFPNFYNAAGDYPRIKTF